MAVIVILGCTGAGKSKLGIELAEKIRGEVISADSMQVYACLDICSAKVTTEECSRVKHHMLNVASPKEKFDVVQFRKMALPIIHDIHYRGKVPVIVGGTNYYIEALLWDTLMPPPAPCSAVTSQEPDLVNCESNSSSNALSKLPSPPLISSSTSPSCQLAVPANPDDASCQQVTPLQTEKSVSTDVSLEENVDSSGKHGPCDIAYNQTEDGTASADGFASASHCSDSQQLYEQLLEVDPEMAKRLHPNNIRKIQRSLEVFRQHGVPHSQLVAQQRAAVGEVSGSQGGPLRFPSACVLWIQCDMEVLDDRLHRRVDTMLHQGLMQELEEFHRSHGCAEPDFTHGVFQSIGYKEFFPYLTRPPTMDSAAAAELQAQCALSLKRSTCRYARKQTSWIKNRFLKDRTGANMLRVYGLDSSDVRKWEDNVLSPAVSIVQAALAGRTPAHATLSLLPAEEETWSQHTCDLCGRVFHGDHEWKVHLTSRSHRRQRKRKQPEHRSSPEEQSET